VTEELERLKWFLWHGNVFRALQVIEALKMDLDDSDHLSPEQRKVLTAVTEFGGYLRANAASIPNYGERYRAGETISSAFVESTVNQVVRKRMVKKQRCAGRPRARTCCSRCGRRCSMATQVLNGEWAGAFQRWYPAFVAPTESPEGGELAAQASAREQASTPIRTRPTPARATQKTRLADHADAQPGYRRSAGQVPGLYGRNCGYDLVRQFATDAHLRRSLAR
jgi:hypothetical protein